MSGIRRAYDFVRGEISRDWERIRGIDEEDAMRELDASLDGPASPRVPARTPADDRQSAQRVLGVAEGAGLDDIQSAHDRLMERSDPSRYPEGTEERKQADAIRLRVRRAFALLTEGMDGTERRFRTLEL